MKQQGLFAAVLLVCMLIFPSAKADSGFIRGSVTDAITSAPVDGMRVRVYDSNWTFLADASTTTDPDGSYISGSLPPGIYYIRVVSIYPQPYITQYWYNTFDRDLAIPVIINEGETVGGINFLLEKGGYIRGTILNTESQPLEGLDLDFYCAGWHWISAFSAMTDSGGTYTAGPLPPDSYYIRADPAWDHGCQQRYWPDTYYRDSAVFIVLNENDDIPGIDFTLPVGGSVTGNIGKLLGGIAENCQISAFSSDWREQPIHQVFSDDKGEYLAYGLPEGNFYLKAEPVHGSGADDTYYPDHPRQEDAESVSVVPGLTVEDIDFILPEGNFDIDLDLDLPSDSYVSGDTFYLNILLDNDGPNLENLPVFLILDIADVLYFWPGWKMYDPPDHPFIDYSVMDIPEDQSQIVIFPSFPWPTLSSPVPGITIMAAVTNWSLTDLASNLDSRAISFH